MSPTTPRVLAVLAWLAVCVGFVAGPAAAQENFEIQVYGSETMAPGTTMIELHSNVAARGTRETTDHVLRTQGAFHETLELTHGWTSWLETGFYVFASIQPDTTWEWVGNHIPPRVSAPESWELPVGLSLSAEIGYQRRAFRPTRGPWSFDPSSTSSSGPGTWRSIRCWIAPSRARARRAASSSRRPPRRATT